MYSLENVPTKHFKIMLKYLLKMEGNGKKKVLEDALKLLETPDEIELDDIEQGYEEEDVRKSIKEAKIKRIEKVANILS